MQQYQKQNKNRSNIIKGFMHLLSLFFLDYFCLFDFGIFKCVLLLFTCGITKPSIKIVVPTHPHTHTFTIPVTFLRSLMEHKQISNISGSLVLSFFYQENLIEFKSSIRFSVNLFSLYRLLSTHVPS